MQDYLTLSELIRLGYTNLTINLIDHQYHPEHENYSEKMPLITTLKQKLETLNFKISIQEYAFNKPAAIGAINVFFTAYDYLDAVKQNKTLASNILLAVDVGQYPVETFFEAFDREINTFEITIKEKNITKNLLLFLPKYGPIRLYANKELPKKIIDRIFKVAKANQPKPTRKRFSWGLPGYGVINKSNQYIIFHELVMEALADNSIAFLLGNNKIIEITKQKLKNEKFITLFELPGGDYYDVTLKKYKRIKLEEKNE